MSTKTTEAKEFIVTFPGPETNFDLNIWDRVGYTTEYKEEGWYVSVYEIPYEGSPYGSGKLREDLGFWLYDDEVQQLTLGVRQRDGGDYAEDSDFWLDVDSFFQIYKNIPARVAEKLRNLA